MEQAQDFINLQKYPVNAPDSPQGRAFLEDVRAQLAGDGCAVLKGFVKPEMLARLVEEADRASPNACKTRNKTNVYFTQDDPDLPDNHRKRRFFDRSNAFIPADNFGAGSALRMIYNYEPLFNFFKAVLEQDKFYYYADPLADVIVNMADEGNGFPWHFDTNNFTVTLALQSAEKGGDFDYAPNIRTGDENFAEVARVLEGTSGLVKTLKLEPGDLQIFKGRYSLHRVAPLFGKTPRYVAIFSYVEQPGMVGSPERTRQLYGKVLPIHWEKAGLRADNYLD